MMRVHPYMSKKCFPNNWATAKIVKQYMKNHHHHAVHTGCMKRRGERRLDTKLTEAAGNEHQEVCCNVDDNEGEVSGDDNE